MGMFELACMKLIGTGLLVIVASAIVWAVQFEARKGPIAGRIERTAKRSLWGSGIIVLLALMGSIWSC